MGTEKQGDRGTTPTSRGKGRGEVVQDHSGGEREEEINRDGDIAGRKKEEGVEDGGHMIQD